MYVRSTFSMFSNDIISRPQSVAKHSLPCHCVLDPLDPNATTNVSLYPNGMKLAKKCNIKHSVYRQDRKPKSTILGFSKSSKRNLRETLMKLELKPFCADSPEATENSGFFFTLDWPIDSCLSKEDINKDLEKFSKRIRKKFEGVFLGGIWKKERKKKGKLHIHINVLFSEVILTEEIRCWVESMWTSIIGLREAYGIDVRPLYGQPERLIHYMTKDANLDSGETVGRAWGKWNASRLPFADSREYGLSNEDHAELIERVKQLRQARPSKMLQNLSLEWQGFRVIGNGDELEDLLDGLPSDI